MRHLVGMALLHVEWAWEWAFRRAWPKTSRPKLVGLGNPIQTRRFMCQKDRVAGVENARTPGRRLVSPRPF